MHVLSDYDVWKTTPPWWWDDGEEERLEAELHLEAHLRDPEPEDEQPFVDGGECSVCRSDRLQETVFGLFCGNCGENLFGWCEDAA